MARHYWDRNVGIDSSAPKAHRIEVSYTCLSCQIGERLSMKPERTKTRKADGRRHCSRVDGRQLCRPSCWQQPPTPVNQYAWLSPEEMSVPLGFFQPRSVLCADAAWHPGTVLSLIFRGGTLRAWGICLPTATRRSWLQTKRAKTIDRSSFIKRPMTRYRYLLPARCGT